MTTNIVSPDLADRLDQANRKRRGVSRDTFLDALTGSALFGSSVRGEVLVIVAALGRTYPRELARLVDRPISMVQKIVAGFERSGVLVSRRLGSIREVSLNPDFVVAKELKQLLSMLLEKEPRYSEMLPRSSPTRASIDP